MDLEELGGSGEGADTAVDGLLVRSVTLADRAHDDRELGAGLPTCW